MYLRARTRSGSVRRKESTMRKSTFITIAAIILGLTVAGSSLAAAQSQETTHTTKKTFGYLDSRGVFHAIPRAIPDPEVNGRTYSGTLEVDVTITLETKITTSDKVMCEADFIASSTEIATQSVIGYEETAMVYASTAIKTTNPPTNPASMPETSPSTVSCKVLIPYSWTLLPSGPEYTNSLQGDLSLVIASVSTTTGAQTPLRTNQQPIPVLTFPEESNGSTTKYTVKATL